MEQKEQYPPQVLNEKTMVYSKLQMARGFIKESKMKKDGKNSFAKYDYFTPSLISRAVNYACGKVGLMWVFSLKKDQFGTFGQLEIIDMETGQKVVTELRTEKPEIKATNSAQQMGGLMTYTQRYMLMSAFDIVDNELDFDKSTK